MIHVRTELRKKKIVHSTTTHATDQHDTLTVAAVAVIVYAISSLLHEGVGHGGACLAVHGVAQELSSMHFTCSLPPDASTAERVVAAAGTIATLLGGIIALLLAWFAPDNNVWRYTLWLFAAVNLMQGTGYLLYSGIGNIGDWAVVIDEWQPAWAWRAALAVSGFILYMITTIWLFRSLDPFVGEARPRRYTHALKLALLPYFVGGLLELAAGILNPGGLMLVLISGVAASFGGTSGLAWGPQTLRGKRTPSAMLEVPVTLIERSWLTVAVAIAVAAVFIAVFGPGLKLTR
jgi:hypothetical protein